MNFARESKRIRKLISTFPELVINKETKIAVLSDLHMNKDSGRNNLKSNQPELNNIVLPYYDAFKFDTIYNGDISDLWEAYWYAQLAYKPNCLLLFRFLIYCLYWIKGNHDGKINNNYMGLADVVFTGGVRLVSDSGKFLGFITHGHHVDFFNRPGVMSTITRFFVRYGWTTVEDILGFFKKKALVQYSKYEAYQYKISPQYNLDIRERVDSFFDRFCEKEECFGITAHTHNAAVNVCGKGLHANSGCWTKVGGDTIEIVDGILRRIFWDSKGVRKCKEEHEIIFN